MPAAKMTMRPFSRWRTARRRMYDSATWCISMALMTRVKVPMCSRAFCSARALMTVASMPMWSAVARSTPSRRASIAPRMMLPPPMTRAISTPSFLAAMTWRQIPLSTSWSIPHSPLPSSASPLSLSRTRL